MRGQGNQGLVLDRLEVRDNDTRLVAIDATVAPSEVLTLMGPSGSGKSTLINAIAGFLQRDFTCTGHIRLNGRDITALAPERRRVGVLFQDPLLFLHFSVVENVMYALPPGIRGRDRRAEACRLLAAVGLEALAARDPAILSGGQKARVALVRVMAARPDALLLDEPFSRLDADLRDSVRRLVFAEVAARGLPTLMVTHDPSDAAAAGGPVKVLGE